MILRDLYSIRPLSTAKQITFAEMYSRHIKEWRHDIPGFLQVNSKHPPPLIPIFQRQRDVLNFIYWHALILLLRPLLLKNFTQLEHESPRAIDENYKSRIEDCVSLCLEAAVCIVDRVEQMFESGRMFRSFWV